jgi:K+-transporting ATPase c subunit
MFRYLTKSILLLALTVVICCVIYPLAVWASDKSFFRSRPTVVY